MNWISALWLGVLQGITEFLPVSSTAHLSLLEHFWGLDETPRFFDVMLHLGTLVAVLIYYRTSLWAFVRAALTGRSTQPNVSELAAAQPSARPTTQLDLSAHARKLAVLLILATLPAVIAGGLFRPTKRTADANSLQESKLGFRQTIGNWREYSSERPGLVAIFLTVTGVVLVATSWLPTGEIGPARFHWKHALAMGIAQAFSAVCPGLSRSGMTISSALAIGVEPALAVHFSLLMSIPAVLGAAVLKTKDLDPAWLTPTNMLATAIGVAVSAVVGLFCILLLMRAVQRKRWWCFGVYVWLLAAVVGFAILRT